MGFSAQAVARSDENRAKQIASTIGRIGIGLLTKGASEAGFTAADCVKGIKRAAAKHGISAGIGTY